MSDSEREGKDDMACFSRAARTTSTGRSGVILRLAEILALTSGLFFGQPAFSQEASPPIPASANQGPASPGPVSARTGIFYLRPGIFDLGPDGNLILRVDEIRREVRDGEKIDSILSSRFEPLHKVWDPFVDKLNRRGLDIALQYTPMVQNSSDLIPGIENMLPGAQNTLSGGDVDLAVIWNAYRPEEASAGYFRLSAEHRHGYSKLFPAGMGSQIGSLWPTLRGWNEYPHLALTEAYWHQGTLKSPFEYRIGRIKNTTIWNGGKYIGGNTGIVGGEVTGTPALIVLSSAWSINAAYHPVGGNTHIAVGVFQANVDNQNLQPLRGDQLIYALQMGWKPQLRRGKGRYHIFAWHVDETDKTTNANGFALNAEQNVGNWTPFFRYSFGDQDRSDPKSHPIRQSVNIGIGYNGVFGQKDDWLAMASTWAQPTDQTLRDQSGLEIDYSFKLTPHSTLTPHVQWIRNPSRNLSEKNISVIGLRMRMDF